MNEPLPEPAGPAGELGAAFAWLADDAPPATMRAGDIIAEAMRGRARRRTQWIGAAAGVAMFSVLTSIILFSGPGTSTTTSASTAVSEKMADLAAPEAQQSAMAAGTGAAPLPADGTLDAAAGGDDGSPPGAVETLDQGPFSSEAAESAADCTSVPLSVAQMSVIRANLSDLSDPQVINDCVVLPGMLAYADFVGTGDLAGASVTVVIYQRAPGICGVQACAAVPGHPDVSYFQVGDGVVTTAVEGVGAQGAVTIYATPGTGPVADPFTPELLGLVADQLLATL